MFNHLRFSILCSMSIGSALAACSSQPPVKPSAPKMKIWSSELKTMGDSAPQLPPKQVSLVHELWTEGVTPPSLSRVEVTLAATGVLAESNGSQGQYLITVGPGECKTEWISSSRQLGETRASRLSQCRDQLNEQSRRQLESAKSMWRAKCSGLSGGGVIDLHNIAVALAKASQSPDAVEGEEGEAQFPSPAWVTLPQQRCGEIKKLNQYLSKEHITFERAQLPGDEWAVWTKGMTAFGLSEIGLILVPPSRLEVAESTLLAAADFALRVEGLSEGLLYRSGMTQGIYASAKRVAQHQSALSSLPKGLSEALIIVDPAATLDNQEAIKKITLKLTVP